MIENNTTLVLEANDRLSCIIIRVSDLKDNASKSIKIRA